MAAALPWSRWHQFARLVLGSRRRGAMSLPPGLLASWHERLERVRSLLAREPRATMTWYWRAHERVLDFMLKRYAPGRPVQECATPESPTVPGPAGSSPVEDGQARTLPAELVPAAKPIRASPDPDVVERARAHLADIAVANLAADKPPPPVFVPPRPLIPHWQAPPRREVRYSPWLEACLIGGALLLQVPIMLAGFVLGHPVLGIGIGLGIACTAIVVAFDRRDRCAKPQAPAKSEPLSTCPRCGYDLRQIPRGRCPECGRTEPPPYRRE